MKYTTARRYRRQADGLFHIKGRTYKHLVGRRQQVGGGYAYKTAGGLTQDMLTFNGLRWVSKNKHESSKRENRLQKYGYGSRKGHFGYVRINH